MKTEDGNDKIKVGITLMRHVNHKLARIAKKQGVPKGYVVTDMLSKIKEKDSA